MRSAIQMADGARLERQSQNAGDSARRRFSDLETGEPADRDLVFQAFGQRGDVFADSDFRVLFHETLIHQTDRLEELLQLALEKKRCQVLLSAT